LEDLTYEGNENFLLVVSNISASATAGDVTGSATIVEDDAQPAISINDTTITEGGNLSFAVTLSNPSTQNVSVSYVASGVTAISGSDYTHTGGTVTILAGTMTGTVIVATTDDGIYEPSETVHINLSSPTNGTISDSQGIGTITDNDSQPSMSIDDVTVLE
jgi:hypothetical protein